TTNGAVCAYLFHGSDPLSCAWHPGGRLIAVGCADGSIRVWDITAARSPHQKASTANEYDVPPILDVPAVDVPLRVLQGQRGPVTHLAFDTGGKWLAALDQAGFLRVFCGFSASWFSAAYSTSNRQEVLMKTWETPTLMIETRVDDPAGIANISATSDSV